MSQKILNAVRNSQYSQLILYMRHKYNFKVKTDPDGSNILMIALQIPDPRRRFKMLDFLLKHNLIDILDQNSLGHDIFFVCVIQECEKELELIMKYFHSEIDWKRIDNEGKTLLHYAVMNNNLNILETLLRYCSKYKINVDIPDKINKITPYLLACRMNHLKAADLLVQIGHASKNQLDQSVYYDSERWKKEGQIELIKNYLKKKQEEMNYAKVNGNIKAYKELNNLSQSLDNEVDRNPDILPILAKVLVDHEPKENVFMKKKMHTFSSIPLIRAAKSTDGFARDPIIRNIERSSTNYFQPQNKFSARFKHDQSKSSTYSSSSITPISSSNSSSVLSNYGRVNNAPVNVNMALKQTIDIETRKRSNSEITRFNSLFEMVDDQVSVDGFVSSKPEAETTNDSNLNYNNEINNSQSHNHHNTTGISGMFLAASLQNTGNYRKTVKYVPDIPVFSRKDSKQKKKKAKSNFSTFKLITIQEENRLASSFRNKSTKLNFNNDKSPIRTKI